MSNKKTELLVAALENGTVIDHIPADKLFEVVNLLDISSMSTNVTIGNNLDSKKLGKKGLIKVSDKYFTDEEVSRISLVAPNVVLNTIQDYRVVDKREVKMPSLLRNIVKCSNPNCITNNEPTGTIFHLVDSEKGTIRCQYCEKEINVKNIELI